MNTTTKAEQTALTLPERAAVALGDAANEAKLRDLVAKSASIVTVTNVDGREEAHRAGMVLLKTRTGIRATGKAARDDAQKFSKAVIAMEDQMIAIIEPEEHRVLALRDAFDEKVAAEKAALVAAERARIEAIQARITSVRNLPASTAGKSGAEISQMIYELAGTITQDDAHAATFEEFATEYKVVRTETLELLAQAEANQLGIEAAAREAEAARQAEIARIAAEREELAQLRAAAAETARLAKIESDRIAAQQATEAKRLADVAAAQQAEQARVAADVKRQLEAQQAVIAEQQRKLAEQQAAADARDAAALAVAQDAERREDDHGPALIMNAEYDAERARLQALADQNLADKREAAEVQRITGVAMPTLPYAELGALTDAADNDLWPTDTDIVDAIVEAFNMARSEVIDRLAKFDSAAALAELEAA